MKKYLAWFLALVMTLALVACGGASGGADNSAPSSDPSPAADGGEGRLRVRRVGHGEQRGRHGRDDGPGGRLHPLRPLERDGVVRRERGRHWERPAADGG